MKEDETSRGVDFGARRVPEEFLSGSREAERREVDRGFEAEHLLDELLLDGGRRELVPQARARGIYTDEDVFKIVS